MAPPLFVMVTNSLDKTLGIETLEHAIVAIEEKIKSSGGSLIVKMKVLYRTRFFPCDFCLSIVDMPFCDSRVP